MGFFGLLIKDYWKLGIMEVVNGIEEKDYILLKDLRIELPDKVQEENWGFSLCFGSTLASMSFFTFCNSSPGFDVI